MTDEDKRARDVAYNKAWRKANREKHLAAQRRYREKHRTDAVPRWQVRYASLTDAERLWESARKRAVSKGLPFTIAKSDIVIPAACPVLGVALERGKGIPQASSPSLDRIDNSKGYVPGKVQVVSNRANSIKRDATLAELEALVAHLRRLRDRGVGFVESGNQT
jgi:hypothetical protein